MPKIPGIEKFAGKTIHAIHFNRHQDEFKGKRVLLIGLHASTQDVVLALKNHGAAQVYATHRNGVSLVSFPGTSCRTSLLPTLFHHSTRNETPPPFTTNKPPPPSRSPDTAPTARPST